MTQLDGLVEAGNTVIVVEHDMRVVSGSDWVIDIGPGAGDEGGRVVAQGAPAEVARAAASRTAPYLARFLNPADTTARQGQIHAAPLRQRPADDLPGDRTKPPAERSRRKVAS
jgi:excinuclease ABC subunit A